jgi:type VII secretion effector (TIGR04197 family)
MPKIKVKLSEATSNKKNIQGAVSSFATNINYSNSTFGIHAKDEAVSISEQFKSSREKLKVALKRDADKIESLTVDFLEIDKTASNKSSTSVGKHSKR